MSGNRNQRLNQAGMVSFLVTLIMMAVITLIVVGFSQVTRRNEREALDRQLSAQAFYAAESGVNVTKANIASYIQNSPGSALPTKTTCANDYPKDSVSPGTAINPLSSANGVKYTCVLVDPNPSTLVYDKLTQGNSIVVPINASGPLGTLSFNWSAQPGSPWSAGNCPGGKSAWYLPAAANWNCPFALLRVDIMQVPGGLGSISGSNDVVNKLAKNTDTLFLTPYGSQSGGLYDNTTGAAMGPLTGGLSFGGANAFYGGAKQCATTGKNCLLDVKLASPLTNYYLRITPMYRDINELIISGQSGGSAAQFNGTQAVVDVTGQAQDELRRIQVRVGLQGSADVPANAVASSTSICKNFTILPSDNIDNNSVCK